MKYSISMIALAMLVAACASPVSTYNPSLAFTQSSSTSYLAAGSKSGRCAALVNWYEATLKVAGSNAFSPHVHVDQLQKITARGFVDDVFSVSIGAPYSSLTSGQRRSLSSDIGSCETGPVDPRMRNYLQAAFSNNARSSMERGWPSAIAAAQRVNTDRASFRGGQSHATVATQSLPKSFVPYVEATRKDQRCAALQKWYERGIALSGPNTFGQAGVYSHDVMASFSRAFVDDIFPIYFGVKYLAIKAAQGVQIQQDVLTCNTPAVGSWARIVASAFDPNRRNRGSWEKLVAAERQNINGMRRDAIPEREIMAEVKPPQDKALGPFDPENRRYSRIIYSDSRITVGVGNHTHRKCQRNIGYSVGIDLTHDERITPEIVKDLMDNVLVPLSQRECPNTDLIITARIFNQTLSVAHGGKVVPAGSVKITGETEMAAVNYGPHHRAQKVPPSIWYGGVNKNWPELASFNGIVDYETRGNRNSVMAERYSPKSTESYVNYQPSETPAHLKGLVNGRLIHQMAARDFLGIYQDGFTIDRSSFSNPGLDAWGRLMSLMSGGVTLDSLSDVMAPRKRVFVWAIQAYSENCKSALGSHPDVYRDGAYIKTGETEVNHLFNRVVTQHLTWKWDDPVYMEPAYYDIYVEMFKTEKAILARELMRLRGELSIEQLFAGEATRQPYSVVIQMKNDAASYFHNEGCKTGKQLLQNWAEFIRKPAAPVRADGRYPTIMERREDWLTVYVADLPPSIALQFPYEDGRLDVEYYGNRGDGLQGYTVGPFNYLHLLGRRGEEPALTETESDEVLASFRTSGVRSLDCRYARGTANYWMEGFPPPNELQRQVAGSRFRGTALRCPVSWPG